MEDILDDYLNLCEYIDDGIIQLFKSLLEKDYVCKLLHELKTYHTESYKHCLRVYDLSYFIAIWARIPQGSVRLEILGEAALLHDIGKLEIPLSILAKPARLTDSEFAVIKCHSVLGAARLVECKAHPLVVRSVHEHHEKIDGSGYPLHKVNSEILMESKLISVADIFDAITVKRCYNDSVEPLEAICTLRDTLGLDIDMIRRLSFRVRDGVYVV